MKLYAQHGYGPGEKMILGFQYELLDGVVLGAKDQPPAQIDEQIANLRAIKPDADILFDCHYYASTLPRHSDNRLGNLAKYAYWDEKVRNDLYFLDPANIEDDIRRCIQHQNGIDVSSFISPNIVVRHSLDSREGVASTVFIGRATSIARSVNSNRPLFITLAISREALLDSAELERFVFYITSLDPAPDGFYILLALAGQFESEVLHADVIANLLYLLSSLKLNGFQVIMGYSDLLGPLLATVGADASCTGWFSTLRMFSLNRFEPSAGGGKPPRPLYFSARLFRRILVSELLAAHSIEPAVRNRFPTDRYYFENGEVIEPDSKAEECLQSWETIGRLQRQFSQGTQRQRISALVEHLEEARALYERLRQRGVSFESKSSASHLPPLLMGLEQFRRNL